MTTEEVTAADTDEAIGLVDTRDGCVAILTPEAGFSLPVDVWKHMWRELGYVLTKAPKDS